MAVSVTYTDRGVYHEVDLAGSGSITLAEIYAAIGDDNKMLRTGTAPYVYTFKLQAGENYVMFDVNSGVTLTCEANDTLNWEWSNVSTTYWLFYIDSGATINVAEGFTFDFNSNGGTYARGYLNFSGTVNFNGVDGNGITLQNYRSCYCYMYDTTAWDWDYVTFQNTTYTTGYILYFSQGSLSSFDCGGVEHNFNQVTVKDDGGEGYLLFYYGDWSAMTFSNWTIDNLEEMGIYYNSALKLENWTMKNNDDYTRHYWNGYGGTYPHYSTSKTSNWWMNGYGQPLIVYDTCEFDAQDGGVYSMLAYSGGTYLVKSCTFKNATYGMYAFDSIILLYGTQTYDTITTDKSWSGGGTFLHVRAFDITVQDVDGTAIENAHVSIRQKEDKEEWSFYTDANGQVKSVFGDSLYLVEKEETSEGVYTDWSDGTGNQIHEIIVSHPDYDTNKQELAMTADKDITVTLRPQGTKIYDSTIYDATIY